tara:strand:+ start:893 stop:1759 length:867 start_codon:yes stop_codon:yes gene_type:complete
MINFKNINKLYWVNHINNKAVKMSKEKAKIVDSSKQEQLTMIDNIVIGTSELGNKRIVLTTMIINSVKSGKVILKYKDKITGLERTFKGLNKITNADVRGFVNCYKEWLGVDADPTWDSKTDTGKERLRILKDSFWVALPMIKVGALQKNKSGKEFTGNKNSEVFVDGEFAKNYSPNPMHSKESDQVTMKFSELKKASQNYLNDKSTDLSSDELASKDNSFVSSIKKLTRTINASKDELVLKDQQAGTEQAIKHLETACVNWTIEFNKVRQSNMTPEQVARLSQKKTA